MNESSSSWKAFVTDRVARGGVDAIGIPPFAGASSAASYANVIDPDQVAREVFGAQLDLGKGQREQLLAFFTRAVPLDAGAAGGESNTGRPFPRSSAASAGSSIVGPFAPVFHAAQTLQGDEELLNAIKPLAECGQRTECCDYQTLIPLIRDTVSELVRVLGTPDVPFMDRVDVLLGTLCGYDVTKPQTFDIENVGGALGDLRSRCGLDPSNICSLDDEKIITAFESYVASTDTVAQRWRAVQSSTGNGYLGVATYPVRRHLFAIMANLGELRGLVSPAAWHTADLQTTPPMPANKLYEWIHQYASTQALQILASAGRDGLQPIVRTMTKFRDLLDAGFLQASKPAKATAASPKNYCSGIPPAFDKPEVAAVVKEILCHIQNLIAVAESITCNPASRYRSPDADVRRTSPSKP